MFPHSSNNLPIHSRTCVSFCYIQHIPMPMWKLFIRCNKYIACNRSIMHNMEITLFQQTFALSQTVFTSDSLSVFPHMMDVNPNSFFRQLLCGHHFSKSLWLNLCHIYLSFFRQHGQELKHFFRNITCIHKLWLSHAFLWSGFLRFGRKEKTARFIASISALQGVQTRQR